VPAIQPALSTFRSIFCIHIQEQPIMSDPNIMASRIARQAVEDWVLANAHLRVTLRSDNLTLSVEDLATGETWGSDPWENSAGRIYLRGKNNDTLTVGLSGAAEKQIEVLTDAQSGTGLKISLSKFRSRLGPVRRDRGIEDHLSLELQLWLAAGRPELTCRVDKLGNTSRYWKVETIEWPLRMFPVRTALSCPRASIRPATSGISTGSGSASPDRS
jgi:hypothetical protein